MRALCSTLVLLAACASRANSPVSLSIAQRPTPRFVVAPPRTSVGAGVAMERSFSVVRAPNPIQFPRSYWVGRELWTTFSTMHRDSMEVHVARTDLERRATIRTELLTADDHRQSAFASLAQSPDRIAIAYDDDGYGDRMTRFVMVSRPREGEPLSQPLRSDGIWAVTDNAVMAYSPTLREWATISASRDYLWSVRLRDDGSLIEGSGMRLPNLRYEHRCGTRLVWNGTRWVALVLGEDGAFAFFERDARQHRVRPLRLRPRGTLVDAAFVFARDRYAVAWVDDEGLALSIVHDPQQVSAPRLTVPSSRRPGTPALSHDGRRFVVLWTETADRSTLHRAFVTDDGAATPAELVASHPAENVWWPHVAPREDGRPLVFTFQVGQYEARVWAEH